MMENRRSTFDILSSVFGEYLSLRTDDFRKKTISVLSTGFSRIMSAIVILTFLMVALFVFAIALTILIGQAVDSYIYGAFITGGVYLLIAVILFLLRKKLFYRIFSRTFTNISGFSTTDASTSQGWKSIMLHLIRQLRAKYL